MSYELRSIIEYDAARIEVKKLTKKIGISLNSCSEYYNDNCIAHINLYNKWERQGDGGTMEEPEFISPCDECKKTFELFKERSEARKLFGIAKVRLSRIARDYRNSTVLHVDEI